MRNLDPTHFSNGTPHEQAVYQYQQRRKFFRESPRHKRGKLRLCKIFRDRGFKTECERGFPCFIPGSQVRIKYQVDVFATRGYGENQRRIIAEVDGYVGHKTQNAIAQQNVRSRRIKERYGQDIEIYRFTFSRLTHWTEDEIAEELNL